jgi:hypothetical protein
MVSPFFSPSFPGWLSPISGRCRTVLGGPGAWKTSLRSVGCAKRRIGRANAAGQHRSRVVAGFVEKMKLPEPSNLVRNKFPAHIHFVGQIGIQSAFRWGFTMDLPTISPSTEDMVFPLGRATVPWPSRWDWTEKDVGWSHWKGELL